MRNALLSIIIAAIVAYLVVTFANPATKPAAVANGPEQSTFDRILASKTLRCGYVPYNPLIIKDAKTGEITGVGADIHKRIAEILGAKLVWTSETSWSTYIEDLKAKRFDMLCDMDFMFPLYVPHLQTNLPVLYTVVMGWARPEDAPKFSGKPVEQFNSPDITISGIDGTIPMVLAQESFPKAKMLGMPALTDYTLNLLNVVDKKADVTFVEKVVAEAFLKTHPGALINVTPDKPLRIYAYSIPTLMGDTKMKEAMANIIGYMLNNGEIDAIVHKYGVESGYYVAEQPYRPTK